MASKAGNKKQLRSFDRRRKYAAVLNAWGSAELANRARDWSDERIYNQLGIVVPKSIPKRRRLSKKTIERKRKAYDRYVYLQAINRTQYDNAMKPAVLRQLVTRGYSDKRIKQLISAERYAPVDKAKVPAKAVSTIDKLQIRRERMAQWREWSRTESYPAEIENMALTINRFLGRQRAAGKLPDLKGVYSDSSHLGWIIAYWAYINNESWRIWYRKIKFASFDSKVYMVVGG